MDQTLNTQKPSIQQQIEFVRGARHLVYNSKREITVNEADHTMLTAIEENLIAVKLWNKVSAKTLSENKAVEELVKGLIDAKENIKSWHDMGSRRDVAARTWAIYEKQSPEIIRINELIEKYSQLPEHLDGEEVHHG